MAGFPIPCVEPPIPHLKQNDLILGVGCGVKYWLLDCSANHTYLRTANYTVNDVV